MKIEKMFNLLSEMNEAGLQSYFWDNTVVDIMNDCGSQFISIVTTAGPKKIEKFFASKEYKNSKYIEAEKLYTVPCGEEGLILIRTLKYETFDGFTKKSLPTDFTCNTLLMNEDRQVLDIHQGLSAVKDKKFRMATNKSLSELPFTYSKFNSICKQLLIYGFVPENKDTARQLCEYIVAFASRLNNQRRVEVCRYLVDYVNNGGSLGFLRIFLSAPTFYARELGLDTAKEIDLTKAKVVTDLDKETLIVALCFLFQVIPNCISEDNELLNVVNKYGKTLFTEEEYDVLSDEYSYDVLEKTIRIHNVLRALKGEEAVSPTFHHKPFFEEAKSKGFTWQGEVENLTGHQFVDVASARQPEPAPVLPEPQFQPLEKEKENTFGQDFPDNRQYVEQYQDISSDYVEFVPASQPAQPPVEQSNYNPYAGLQNYFSGLTHRNGGANNNG